MKMRKIVWYRGNGNFSYTCPICGHEVAKEESSCSLCGQIFSGERSVMASPYGIPKKEISIDKPH